MHERPPDLSDDTVRRRLHQGWRIDAAVVYAAVGFGGHHWIATGGTDRWFLTVDDLRARPTLGDAPGEGYRWLSLMHLTARALHDDGLEFVVAPMLLDPASGTPPGICTVNLENRWAMSVTPYVEGTAWGFSDTLPATRRDELITALARLHATAVPNVEMRTEVPPSGREALIALLDEHEDRHDGGPYAEQAGRWLRSNRHLLRDRLAQVDAVAARVGTEHLVVTHGEPHAGNLVGAPDGLRLVDWDTVALAPRERDLWLVGDDEATISAYEAASGAAVDRTLLAAYRLAWDLADVVSFLDELRGPHHDTADTRAALGFLQGLELAPLDL